MNKLENVYTVISLSFESIGEDGFQDEDTFVKEFCRLLRREFRRINSASSDIKDEFNTLFYRKDEEVDKLKELLNKKTRELMHDDLQKPWPCVRAFSLVGILT